MRAFLAVALWMVCVPPLAFAGEAAPHRVLREVSLSYPGAGEPQGDPSGLEEIRIGWFGPSDPEHPLGGDLWLAASLAIEEANREGGYHGIPFRLTPAWSDGPWGSGVARLTRLAFDPAVPALLGSVDGASTHLVEQVAARARLPVINPAATDATLHLAGVPWLFSCAPGDQRIVPVLAAALLERGLRRYVLVSSLDHDARALTGALLSHLGRDGSSPVRHLRIQDPPGPLERALASQILEDGPDAVVVISGARIAGRLVADLRDLGYGGLVVGGPGLARRGFPEAAGSAADGTLVPLLVNPDSFGAFQRSFEARFGRPGDATAGHAYDGTRLLIGAIREAGLGRARIREALAEMPSAAGVTGLIDWDPVGQNRRPVRLGVVREGRVFPEPVLLEAGTIAAEHR